MKIINFYSNNLNILNTTTKLINNINFTSNQADTYTKKPQYLMAFDLDGTFAEGTYEDFDKYSELTKNKNCKLVYITSRGDKAYQRFLNKNQETGIPSADYVCLNNGQLIYENINGKLEKNPKWETLQQSKNFSHEKAYVQMDNIFKEIKGIEGFTLPYNDFDTDYNIEYLIGSNKQKKFLDAVLKKMKDKKIDYKCYFLDLTPADVEFISKNQDEQTSKKMLNMVNDKGRLIYLNIGLADKADALKFLQSELKVKPDKVIAAGNDSNDYSLANSGFKFIIVKNATNGFKKFCRNVSEPFKIFWANKEGTAGVNQGIEQFLKGN